MPDTDAIAGTRAARIARKVLLLVQELHVRGYQRLRISPGMSPSGMHWRCAIAPVSLFAGDGIELRDDGSPLIASYSSADEDQYFGWTDARHTTPSRLVHPFVESFPDLVAAGRGQDWAYAGWYVDMLHLTYPSLLPYAYADDFQLTEEGLATFSVGGDQPPVRIPLPPRLAVGSDAAIPPQER